MLSALQAHLNLGVLVSPLRQRDMVLFACSFRIRLRVREVTKRGSRAFDWPVVRTRAPTFLGCLIAVNKKARFEDRAFFFSKFVPSARRPSAFSPKGRGRKARVCTHPPRAPDARKTWRA